MASTIQVVLQHDVANVGASGDLVKVRPGFARNYLIPRNLAVPATAAAISRIQHDKAVALARSEKLKKEARELAVVLSKLELTIAHRAGEDGRLFGSITTKEIEIAAKAKGVTVDRKKMHLADPIRAVGVYEVPVKLMADVAATFKVEVVKA